MSEYTAVARVGQIPAGGMLTVDLGGESVLVVEQDGEYFALQDECSHEEFPLSEGELEDGRITCILHGACFDVRTGEAKSLPAIKPVKTFDVRIEGDEIQVRV